VATGLSAIAYLPVAAVLVAQDRLTGLPLVYAVAAGVLSSVIPYAADLTALRYVPQRLFGVFMSVHPVLAGIAGIVLLGQILDLHEWAGIAIVVTANAMAVAAARRPEPALARRLQTGSVSTREPNRPSEPLAVPGCTQS
jgi:inner membrane transporter RhtA